MNKKNLYRIRLYPIETDANTIEWAAEFPDLPGCVGAGDTAEEDVTMAMDAKRAWMETAREEGRKIPKPKNIYEEDFSGKFTLRLPKSLHKELTLQAEDEGVSLNQYILYSISKGLNEKEEIPAQYVELKDKIDFSVLNWFNMLSNLNWEEVNYSEQNFIRNC